MRKTLSLAVLVLLACTFAGCARQVARAAYLKGCDALEAGSYEEAAAHFGEALEAGYFLPEVYRGKGLAEMSTGNYADASISLEKSLLYTENQDESFLRDTNLYLAYCRERQGYTDKALQIYNDLLMKEPDAETLFLRGRLNLRLGRNAEARADFDQAVQLRPGYDLFINIYQVYEDMERSGDGAAYLELALSEASRNSEDYYELGLVSYYLQNYADAKEMLIKATRQNPDDGRAVFLLGKVYLSTGDVADARAIYKEYTERPGSAAGAYNGLALCDIAEKNYAGALANVEAGLAVGDESAEQGLLYNEIVLYEQQKDWATAKRKATAYIARYPADEAGLREYEFLSTR